MIHLDVISRVTRIISRQPIGSLSELPNNEPYLSVIIICYLLTYLLVLCFYK